MGVTLTTNYSLIKPNIFEEFDSWGTHYNDTMDLIDAALTAIDALADANTASIVAIQAKTDFITITQAVNLDTVESNANTAFGWGDHALAGYATTAAVAAGYQPLDADLTSWAGITRAAGFDTFVATPSSANLAALVTGETGSGALVFGTSPALTTPTITNPTIQDGLVVDTNTLSGTAPALDPASGLVQEWTLTANSTPTDSIADGESIVLLIDDGTAYTITWPTITWLSNDGAAPTLQTTGKTVIHIFKVGTTLYGNALNGA